MQVYRQHGTEPLANGLGHILLVLDVYINSRMFCIMISKGLRNQVIEGIGPLCSSLPSRQIH